MKITNGICDDFVSTVDVNKEPEFEIGELVKIHAPDHWGPVTRLLYGIGRRAKRFRNTGNKHKKK